MSHASDNGKTLHPDPQLARAEATRPTDTDDVDPGWRVSCYSDWRVRNRAEAQIAFAKIQRAAAAVLQCSSYTYEGGVIRLEHYGYNAQGKPLNNGQPGLLNLDPVGIARLLGRHLDRDVADAAIALLDDAIISARNNALWELAKRRCELQRWADDIDPIDTGPPVPLAEQCAAFLKQAHDENWNEQRAQLRKERLARYEREASNGGNR